MNFEVKFHDRDVVKGFERMDARRKRLREAFKQLRPPLASNLREHADQQEAPSTGSKWPRRATRTEGRSAERARTVSVGRERRRRGMSGPLRETHVRRATQLGSLPETVQTKAIGARLVARSAVAWSAVQNEGGVVGHGAVIPAREFVEWDPAFLAVAVDTIAGYVAAGFA